MLKNTDTSYGSVAKWLHWLMVLWLLTAYLTINYLKWRYASEGPMRTPLIGFHKAVGLSVLILLAIRVYWRATNPVPKVLDNLPMWQVQASRVSHFLLYFFMLAMPVSGYVGNDAGVSYGIFHVTAFMDTGFANWIFNTFGITYQQFEVPFEAFHYHIAGPFIIWILVLLHASAAIYHHAILKDNVLKRMLPGNN